MFARILAPIDLAEPTMVARAVAYAEALANVFDGDIRLVNVQSLTPIAFLDYAPADFNETTKLGLEKELADIASTIKRPSDRISVSLLFGPVYQTVLKEAESWGSDAIILCSHRPGMERFLIGSNANAIVRHAACPVLVIR